MVFTSSSSISFPFNENVVRQRGLCKYFVGEHPCQSKHIKAVEKGTPPRTHKSVANNIFLNTLCFALASGYPQGKCILK